MCRSQFDVDDMTEAQILCGTRKEGGSDSPEFGVDAADSPGRGLIRRFGIGAQIERQRPRLGIRSFGTWKVPNWITFSYITLRKPHAAMHRRPIPFESRPSQLGDGPSNGTANGTRGDSDSTRSNTKVGHEIDDLSPVHPHPGVAAWDDAPNLDLPYDNPYYTRSFRNVLWLPRDPISVLDLDDTVDFRMSLTSEPSAGQLGSWLGSVETASPTSLVHPDTKLATEPPAAGVPNVMGLTGEEEIELPGEIAVRVQELDKEDDVEFAQEPTARPAMFRPRKMSTVSQLSTGTAMPRRGSFIEGLPRTFTGTASTKRGRSSSFLPAFDAGKKPTLEEHEIGVVPDAHAQAELAENVFR